MESKIEAKQENSDWKQDPKGYFLIEPRPKENLIYVHHYDNEHNYILSIYGHTSQEIYHTIIRLNLITYLQHAAYLGAELQKAEESIKFNCNYIQDEEIKKI